MMLIEKKNDGNGSSCLSNLDEIVKKKVIFAGEML